MNYRSKILNQIRVNVKREDTKPITMSTILIGSLIFMFLIFVVPSIKTIGVLQAQNNSLRESREKLKNLQIKYQEASDYFEQVKSKVYDLSKNIPDNSEPYYFVDRINLYSVNNSSVLKSVKLIEKEFGVEGYEVSLFGDYQSIEKFFNDLSNDPRFFSVEVLTISQGTDRIFSNNRLALTARVYIFYQLGEGKL